MLKRIRLYALGGMLLSLLQLGIMIWAFLTGSWPIWICILDFVFFSLQGLIYWRLWHMRRWAAIAGLLIGTWFSLSLFIHPHMMLILLTFTIYTAFNVRRAWPLLNSGL